MSQPIDATVNATVYQIEAVIDGDAYQLEAGFGAGPTGARGPAGEVTGPAMSADGNLAVWDGSDGKKLRDGGQINLANLGAVRFIGPVSIRQIWGGTQAQYDSIVTPDPNTLYVALPEEE